MGRSFKLCDGVWDCTEGEDETRCSGSGPISSHIEGTENDHKTPNETCHGFLCSDGRCLPLTSVCDRKIDCPVGSEDEAQCSDDNKEGKFK